VSKRRAVSLVGGVCKLALAKGKTKEVKVLWDCLGPEVSKGRLEGNERGMGCLPGCVFM
jgi:hypothetical protein